MRRIRHATSAQIACTLFVLLLMPAQPLLAADATSPGGKSLTLWVDQKTGQVFVKPGKGRTPLVLPGAPAATSDLEQRIERKVQAQTQATIQQNQAQLKAANDQLAHEVAEIRPAWRDYVDNFKDKIRIGTLVYGDYAFFTHTGYGPQFLTQENWPGPGNNLYNSFDLTRAYLNFFFFPTEDWTLRVTPNLYKMVGTAANDKFGQTGAIGSSLDGNLGYRVKYGYLQYNTPFRGSSAFGDDVVIIGVQPQPITAWEEDLYGFRWVNLTTWNMAVASTFPGIAVAGPIRLGRERLQYADYDIGVFGNGNFHQIEASDTQQAWGRMSLYPFGARWRFDGLGITSMYSYGYGNSTPDMLNLPAQFKGPNAVIQRLAEIVHYTTETWQLAAEFDWGRNAFAPGSEFSASGPAELFGITPGPGVPPSAVLQQQAFAGLSNALLNNGRTVQEGFNFFGHYHISNTPLTLFGWFEQWMPNMNVNQDPFDFQRFVVGVAYQYDEYLSFALDSQNILYYHNQSNFPVGYAKEFNFTSPRGFTGATINDVVPRDTHALMLNVQFAF